MKLLRRRSVSRESWFSKSLASTADEVVAEAASTADEVVPEAVSMADVVMPEAASTADEVVPVAAFTVDSMGGGTSQNNTETCLPWDDSWHSVRREIRGGGSLPKSAEEHRPGRFELSRCLSRDVTRDVLTADAPSPPCAPFAERCLAHGSPLASSPTL